MRNTPLLVRASPTTVVARAESSTETRRDGQKEVEVEENKNAVA